MTLKWWDDLWLNEGFATYIEYKGVNHAQPDWQRVCICICICICTCHVIQYDQLLETDLGLADESFETQWLVNAARALKLEEDRITGFWALSIVRYSRN